MAQSGDPKLWGGRFEKAAHETFAKFNRSFLFDQRLLDADILGSLAQVAVLEDAKIVTQKESLQLRDALKKLAAEVKTNPQLLSESSAEDVHSFIEGHLIEKLGDLGKKVHSGRSRNDQVATALRIWLKNETLKTAKILHLTLSSLLELAEKNIGVVMPAYTHLQKAQPVLFSHWVLAYFEMFKRDQNRLGEVLKRISVLPLGSGALTGSGLPINREIARKELGFETLSANSMDAVSDRDFVIEWMSFASLCMMHLSRLAEDLIIFSTQEFAFMGLGDEISSGSSLMPQKKNPDALELLRGKFGRVLGAQVGMLATLKGLPLAYNKDLQEDKEALFDCVDTLQASLENASIILQNIHPKVENMQKAAERDYMNATDVADLCVLNGVPFREAHEKIGQLVREGLAQNLELKKLSKVIWDKFLPGIYDKVVPFIDAKACVDRKICFGSTGSAQVAQALVEAKKYLLNDFS